MTSFQSLDVQLIGLRITGGYIRYVRALFKSSHRPDGKNVHALVLIPACTTAANASVIFSMYVPQRTLKTSHRPDGKIADALAPTHACTTANASVIYRMYVLQRPCKLPIAPMGKMLTRLL